MSSSRKCFFITGSKATPATLYGVFQSAGVMGESPFIGGHSAGQVAQPVAVIECNGRLREVPVYQVYFERPVEVPNEK